MDENPDDREPNDPNHNYRGGYQNPTALHPFLESRIASDAAQMAFTARASGVMEAVAEAAREQAASRARSASANAVALANIERGEAITGERETEADGMEKWKRSSDAARLKADLGVVRRHSPEVEGGEPETGGMMEKIVPRTEAESGERGVVGMPSAARADMLDAQRGSDKEEMKEDAAWSRKIKKERSEDGQGDGRKQASSKKKQAFYLDGADERKPSPNRTPLPPSRAASVATQVETGSEAPTAAATTSAWRAGVSPASTPEAVLRALYDRNDMSSMSNGERYLIKVIQDRDETTEKLLDHSRAVAGTDRGGLQLLEVVFRTLRPSGLSMDRREECAELLRTIESRGGVHGEDRREKARRMAEGMIDDYRQETRALEQRLIELSGASQPPSKENERVRPGDLLDRINWSAPEEKEEMKKDRASMSEFNLREMERRFGVDLATQLNDRLRRDNAAAGQIPDQCYHPAQAVKKRSFLNTFSVDGEDIHFRPPCLSQPMRATEPATESARGRPSESALLDPAMMYQRYLPQSASRTVSATTSALGGVGPALPLTGQASAHFSRPNPGTASVPASTLGGVGPAQPLTGRSSTYLPHHTSETASATAVTLKGVDPALPLSGPSNGRQPTPAKTMQDILDGVQRGGMDGLLNFNHEETKDNPLPNYALPSALPNANSFLSPSLVCQQPNDHDGAERFSLEREVLASIAAMAGSSINKAQDNEDAQAERSAIADRPAYQAAMDGGKTLAQGLAEDYAKGMREKTMKEREERILKRARQISGQHPRLQAPRGRGEGRRVASQGVDRKDIARSEQASLKTLRPLELNGAGLLRLSGLREDERQAASPSGAPLDLTDQPRNRYSEDWTQPQPCLTIERPHPGPPSGPHAAFLAEYRRASSAARTSREENDKEGKRVDSAENDLISSIVADSKEPSCTPGILDAAEVRKCTTFRPIYIHSARCDGCRQGNKPVLYRCNTCRGQWDSGCMDRDETHNGRGLDWTDHGAQSNPNAGRRKLNRELHRGMDAGESLAEGATAAADQTIEKADDAVNNIVDSLLGEKGKSEKPPEKFMTADTLVLGSIPSAYDSLKPWIAEGRVRVSSNPGRSHKEAKNEDAQAPIKREKDDSWVRFERAMNEAESRADAQRAEPEDEEGDLPGMTDQEMVAKIAALKRLAEEFRRGLPEDEEERKDNPEAVKVLKRFYEDYCREKAETAKRSARQTKYIPAWQRPLERSGTDEAPRPPPPSGSKLAELAKAEAAASAAPIAGISSIKGLKKDSLDSLADRIKQAKLSAAGLKAKASRRLAEMDAIPSSSYSDDSLLRFPTMFLLSLDADMINLAGAFQQHVAVQDLTRGQFFELLERTSPKLWERWKEYYSDPQYMEDTGSEVGKECVGKEQTLTERVEKRSKGYEDGMRKAMDRSVQDRGAGEGKGKEKPKLSIATSRTITDMELQIERAKAFNEGNMAAFKDMETARKKGFEEGVKSVMGQQSSSVVGRSGGEGNKSSAEGLKDTMKKAYVPIAVNGKPAEDKTDEHEEGPFSHCPYWVWVLVQFDSSASDLPRNFPWRSDGLTCELFGIMSPTTLPSLLSSLEAKVKKELEAMKVSEGNPAAAAAGVAGLEWLAGHKISGLTVLWNWRRENSPTNVGAAAMPFVRTPSLRTQVTERNVDGALWMMSKERGHLLLVHADEREEGENLAEKTGEENNSSQEKRSGE